MKQQFLPEYMIDAIPADITAVDGSGNTYVGRFDRDKVVEGTAIEAQPIWMIKKIVLLQTETETVYRTTYPDGMKTYNRVWNDHAELSYTYNKN